jgi:molybdopterin synthase catalytic subunit
MIDVKVLLFASLKEKAGTKEVTIQLHDRDTIRALKLVLQEAYPSLAPILPSCVASINKQFAFDDDLVEPGMEIALFPPVSGGEISSEKPTIFSITQDEIDLNTLLASITLPTTGAACIFTGMVRAITRGEQAHDTEYLEYEAYEPMAEQKMLQVTEEIHQRWPTVEGIAIVQRIGKLFPGTPTVMIACTAPHRDTGVFDAAKYGIDRLKEIVPIWKKEIGLDGESWVEGDYHPDRKD